MQYCCIQVNLFSKQITLVIFWLAGSLYESAKLNKLINSNKNYNSYNNNSKNKNPFVGNVPYMVKPGCQFALHYFFMNHPFLTLAPKIV